MRNCEKRGAQIAGCGSINPQSAIRNLKSHGFTLVETVMTIVIVGILAGLAAMIIMQGVRAYSDEQVRSDVHYQARLAVERIAREARLIRSCADIIGPANPSNTLSFTDINGTAVAFSVAGSNLLRGPDLLASGITSAQPFRFLDTAGNPTTACPGIWYVEIDVIDTQGSESLQMRSRVHPRNF
jgi:prepilin-type N-terminal cleavage/methylation domain-containing protein